MMNIKRTIASVLQSQIIANDTLTSAALLDPRFHRLTTIENLDSCVRMLTQKYNKAFGGSMGTDSQSGDSSEGASAATVSSAPTVTIKTEPNVKSGSSSAAAAAASHSAKKSSKFE